ncbi:hypothetical protein [Streptomyces sp. NPDC046712]|uniref:hypothetical protein n=1 Tax=Streptomyces sp. NPDC046712 TaxID=3154802 RepID=UPI0033E5E0B5
MFNNLRRCRPGVLLDSDCTTAKINALLRAWPQRQLTIPVGVQRWGSGGNQ